MARRRRWWLARWVLVAVLALAGFIAVGRSLAAGPLEVESPLPPGSSAPAGEAQRRLWLLTNQLRVAEGAARSRRGQAPLPLLRYDMCLERAAQQHAQAMADRDFFDHEDPMTGTDPRSRALAAGAPYAAISENIAAGRGSLDDIFALWERSSGHRANLLDPEMVAVGIGVAERASGRSAEPYYTQLLSGAPAPDSASCK